MEVTADSGNSLIVVLYIKYYKNYTLNRTESEPEFQQR